MGRRLKQADREYFGFYAELYIRFDIHNERVFFYETAQPVDNITVFSTFEEAKTAAAVAYVEYKKKMLAELEKNEKEISAITEDDVFGYNPEGGW